MKYILSAKEMQQCDKNTMEYFGVPSAVLMERAALAVAEEIQKLFPDPNTSVLIACGTGNNGGDGLAVARLLFLKGYPVTIFFPGDEKKCSVEAARQLGIVKKYGIDVTDCIPDREFNLVVDAIFGIGLSRDIKGDWRDAVEGLNRLEGVKVAVDIPSGVNTDSGKIMGVAFKADHTVTFGFAKRGHILYPGSGYCGAVAVKDMGIDENSILGDEPHICMAERDELIYLPERYNDSNKGTYGKILIFAGSYNMAGAAAFSAKAACRTGAGLVKVVTDEANREIIQTLVPEAILTTYDEKTDMETYVKEQLEWADSVVVGPGIGRSSQASHMVKAVMNNVKVPCVADADALNILAEHMEWLDMFFGDLIVTPHPGEMARLTGRSIADIKGDLIGSAERFSKKHGVVTVLKDARTVTVTKYKDTWLNAEGNDGMATGGSGDVLTGIIAALAAQNKDIDESAVFGVLVHALAGDAAAKKLGGYSVTATDIIDGISDVLKPVYETLLSGAASEK